MARIWLRCIDLHGEEWVASRMYLQEQLIHQLTQDFHTLQQRNNALRYQIEQLILSQNAYYSYWHARMTRNQCHRIQLPVIDLHALGDSL